MSEVKKLKKRIEELEILYEQEKERAQSWIRECDIIIDKKYEIEDENQKLKKKIKKLEGDIKILEHSVRHANKDAEVLQCQKWRLERELEESRVQQSTNPQEYPQAPKDV